MGNLRVERKLLVAIASAFVAMLPFYPPCRASQGRPLTFEERVKAQEAIERVYYAHRIWPKENPRPKPPFEQMVPRAVIEAKVTDYLKKCAALDKYWQRPIRAEQLQAEMDRMAKGTKDPAMLTELFAALGNDPYLIAECLARPVLADRMIRNWYPDNKCFKESGDGEAERLTAPDTNTPLERQVFEAKTFDEWWATASADPSLDLSATSSYARFFLMPTRGPEVALSCSLEWVHSSLNEAIEGRINHTAVWTGTEMIVWGGSGEGAYRTGQRYDPATDTWTPTSTGANCPSGRYYHTAIWTGTQMIVWGGSTSYPSDSSGGKTGGKYDPLTDSWLGTSTGTNCPSARYGHVAVWTGTRMVVWGGTGVPDNDYLNTGGRYDPSNDTWIPTSTAGACPSGRYNHRAVWTGTQLILWGGQYYDGSSFQYLNDGGRYDPSADTWSATSTGGGCPGGRGGHSLIWTGTVMIAWGGYNSNYLNTGGRYNPVTNTWAPTSTGATCPAARGDHSAVWSGTEMILWGGGNDYQGTGGRYSPSTDTWSATSMGANCPSARKSHTAVWTGSEMIVWGGNFYDWPHDYFYNTGGRYNPTSDTWVPTSVPSWNPEPRSGHSAVWTGAEMIVWGGRTNALNAGGRYYPSLDTWIATSTGENSPPNRSDHVAVWTGTEMLVWGGQGAAPELNSGGRYNPVSDAWTPISTGSGCPSARIWHTAAWSGSEMIVWGGFQVSSSNYTNTGGRYSPATNMWAATSMVGSCPGARAFHSAVWAGTRMVVWGGLGTSRSLNSGGRYDPSTNSWTSTSTGANCPTARASHTALWTGNEMMVWGGMDGSLPAAGGRYNPATDVWASMPTGEGCPAGRLNHTATWTGSQMVVWGGRSGDATVVHDTGGIFDPAAGSWTPTPLGVDTPSPRFEHSAVWTGSRLIVWGGAPTTCTGGSLNVAVGPSITGASSNTCPATTVTLSAGTFSTYQWRYNGTPVPGAITSTYGASLSGNYSVSVTDSGGCAGTSAQKPVTVTFCAQSEVSPKGAVFAARLVKDGTSPTGFYAYFQTIDGVGGYNLYEGTLGSWYSHGSSPGNVCHIPATDLGTGEMRASITPSAGNHYYLVTAFNNKAQGPSGFASSGAQIDPAQSTCVP